MTLLMLNLLNWDEPMFFHWKFVEAILFTSSVLEQRHPWDLDTTQTQTWFLPALGSTWMTLRYTWMKISCAFSEWHTRLVAATLSYERVKSLCSAMQTHKGQTLKHLPWAARSKGKSLPSQPLESLWTSVQKRMVWTSPLWSEWNWSRLILLKVCFRGPSPGNPATL